MFFRQWVHEEMGGLSYFIASQQTGEAAVIDPQQGGPYLETQKATGYRCRYVINTKVHDEHLSYERQIAMTIGGRVYMPERAEVSYRCQRLKDDQVLKLGEIEMRVVPTPGRNPEAISLVVTDTSSGPEPALVLSSDVLFIGYVNHPDFGGPHGLAEEYESIQKLLALPDFVAVFPTHHAGPIGIGKLGRPSSTIGYERRYNPVLKMSREEFLKFSGRQKIRPLNASGLLLANNGTWGDAENVWKRLHPDPDVLNVAGDEAKEWIAQRNPVIVDVREPEEYAAGHLPGAVSIPQADLGLRMEEIPAGREVLFVDAAGGRAFRAAGFLKAAGRAQVAFLEGGTNGWREQGNAVTQ